LAAYIVYLCVYTFQRNEIYGNQIAMYNEAVAKNSTSPKVYAYRGNYLLHLEKKQEALTDYNACLQIKPDYHECLIERGMLLYDKGMYEQAKADLMKA